MLVYVALGLALLALVLLVWHVLTPTPPAHTMRLELGANLAPSSAVAAAGGAA